jgi:shikimate kinase
MNLPDKIVLIGYMASGKTTIGKLLAKTIEYDFIDLDLYISEKEQLTVSELFEQKGEPYFRSLEIYYLKELLETNDSFVLSVGGGTPSLTGVMDLINEKSFSIYLKASIQTLANRLAPKEVERPLLTHISADFLQSYIEMHLVERSSFYEKANISVTVDKFTTDKIIARIRKEITYSK